MNEVKKKLPDLIKRNIRYEMDLNGEQLNVINNLHGKMLISAGAGSGKTRTITYAVAKLIDQGVSPHEIMLVTFTNKAAEEMMSRVKDLLGVMPPITSGTFHSIANRKFLTRFRKKINYGRYEIMDNGKSRDLINKCIENACREEISKDPKYFNTPPEEEDDLFKRLKKQFPKAKEIQVIISSSANCNKTIRQTIRWRFQEFEEMYDKISEINKRYKDMKMKHFKFDFDDLLFFWDKLLEFEDVQEFAKRYKYILVDEYQDTNFIQNEIIIKLAKLNSNSCLFVVGDDAQSIYAFRGADFKNFLNFQDNFKKGREYGITINYRSTPEILDLANDSIKHNEFQIKKSMTTDREADKKPQYIQTEHLADQIEWILSKIIELHSKGEPYDDIALLFRALRGNREEIYQIHNLQVRLTNKKIPFEVRGGISFFEKAHIKDLLAFLNFRDRPKDIFSEIHWDRISKNYIRGLGKTNSEKIYNKIIKKTKNPLEILTNKLELTRIISILKRNKVIKGLGVKAIQNIVQTMQKLMALKGNVGEMISNFINDKLIYDIFEAKYKQNEREDAFQERLNDIALFIETGKKYKSLGKFLNDLTLNESEYSQDKNQDQTQPKVIISTIHKAKGLEWNTVFMPMLSNGFFPNFRNLEIQEDLEEERRVFYVAITRTKSNLFLLTSKHNRKNDNLEQSLFLDELNSELYNKIEK
jgi:DNA helicase-2/ATP-dependent DNA helicase PcrA